jgi:hypothetical protein
LENADFANKADFDEFYRPIVLNIKYYITRPETSGLIINRNSLKINTLCKFKTVNQQFPIWLFVEGKKYSVEGFIAL